MSGICYIYPDPVSVLNVMKKSNEPVQAFRLKQVGYIDTGQLCYGRKRSWQSFFFVTQKISFYVLSESNLKLNLFPMHVDIFWMNDIM